MKLLINGHAQHGKDFFADAVAREFGLRKLNASLWFAETVLMPAFPGMYPCVEAAYLDRVNHRALWYQMMRVGDWQRKFMEHSDIFCGHRNVEEHQEMQAMFDPRLVRSIWVEWLGKPPEDPASTQWTSTKVIEDNHDIILTHAGNGVRDMLSVVEGMLNVNHTSR
ncbi:hypothetical protein ParaMal1_00035 [Paracoccus phage ParMal1]|uniref:Deoxynucleotide monophosphate kinase n=1 Tax=Paracoccus phage ParMal1 TaxID=3032416 RepID=A0AAF0FHX1_9CAUD|nr:hypothetical protein ParaMal1_00035 [Paracoccus phage ParMal1]